MRLGDVIKAVGASELRHFPWGANVVALVNSFVPEHAQINIHSTGNELRTSVNLLDEAHRAILLQAKIGFAPLADPPSTPNTPVVQMAGGEPSEVQVPSPLLEEVIHESQTLKDKNKIHTWVSVGFATVLCAIALILTLSMSYNAIESGGEIDTDKLQTVLSMISDVVKALQPPAPE